MKFTTAYYLTLLYLSVLLNPLIPVISDALSHTFADAIHIATVHAKYGNNHLEVELANEAADDGNNKNPHNINSEESVSVHISVKECAYVFTLNAVNKQFFGRKLHTLNDIFISKQAPPPKSPDEIDF